MIRQAEAAPRGGALVGTGLALIAAYVGAILYLVGTSTYDTWGAMVIGPVLVGLTLPVIAREAAAKGDRRLFWLMLIGLGLRLAGALARSYVAFDLYGGAADATGYHGAGIRISERFRAGVLDPGPSSLPPVGTNFIEIVTGVIYTMIGPTLLGGFLVYSWLAFWGSFLFYKAFDLAVPEGRPATYARLVFLMPSMIFWPSGAGKDAWMLFALGIVAYGGARILTGATWRGAAAAGVGLWLGGLVRPHVVGMAGVAIALAYLLRKPRKELRQLAPLAKAISLALVAAAAFILVQRADQFLRDSRIDTSGGIASALQETTRRTAQGGSEFQPSVIRSPLQAPKAFLTVLFRPLLVDARNLQQLVAALEGTFLLGFTLLRIRWVSAAVRSVRRQPYVVFALGFIAMFVVAFSGTGNFGILTRQRVQILPLMLVLLAIPPVRSRRQGEAHAGLARA